MCVLFVAWRVREDVPLIVAANRDEAYARPAAPVARWDDCPGVVAGRDLQAGGTWMGTAPGGRWSAVTNIRRPEWMARPMPRSRGRLVADFLCGEDEPRAYAARVARERADYGGFNLLLGDPESLYFVSRDEGAPQALEHGLYGLSNGSLDDPWPKLTRGGRLFREWVDSDLDIEAGLALLRDTERAPDHLLPDTGIGIELERLLSPLFIAGETYGTRSSTILIIGEDTRGMIAECTYGPGGMPVETTEVEF